MQVKFVKMAVVAAMMLSGAAFAEENDEGFADERGRFVVVDKSKQKSDQGNADGLKSWGTNPLGDEGKLKIDKTFANKPVFKAPPKRVPEVGFADRNRAGVVVAPKTDAELTELANELAWHLSQMLTDQDVKVVKVVTEIPKGNVPAIILKRGNAKSFLHTDGNRLEIGGEGSAASHAVTYLLEALGCRYLWPGKTGKVIPKVTEVKLPKFDFEFAPVLKIRGMRDCVMAPVSHPEAHLARCGMDPDDYMKAYFAAFIDHEGNRDFYRWHGVNEPQETKGQWGWGHYFHDWWNRYGETNPDFFALQPNGTRKQELGPMSERATMCFSNRELAKETARRRLEDFKALPQYQALSICLPDGGWMGECLCEECRKLDPKNAAPAELHYPKCHKHINYVSLSDRVMEFNNRVAEAVVAERPDKLLTCYIYSTYDNPPIKVKPHPALVFLSGAGDYSNAKFYNWARENMAAWSHLGNPLLWRPNLFMAFRQPIPQNYARRLFDDFETFKCNNVLGTDFDCIYGHWAASWINYYIAAKCHINADQLDYDDLLDETCRASFGKAAPLMKDYLDAVEKLTDEAAQLGKGTEGYLTISEKYHLREKLNAAEKVVAEDLDTNSLERVQFIKRSLDWLDAERRLEANWYAAKGDAAKIRAAQNSYFYFLRKQSREDPIATVPKDCDGYALYSKFLRQVEVPGKEKHITPTKPAEVKSEWNGKKVAFLGDSITDKIHVGTTKNYWNYLTDTLGLDSYIYGLNGERWKEIYAQAIMLKEEQGDSVDAIFVFAGTNDYNNGDPIGDWYDIKMEKTLYPQGMRAVPKRVLSMDTGTLCGRINRALSYLKHNFPNQQIVVMTPIHRAFAEFGGTNVQPPECYPNRLGLYVDAYVDKIREAGAIWSVPVIDLYADSGLLPMDEAYAKYFASTKRDMLHPNDAGHKRLAKTIAARLLTLPANFK